MTKAWRALPRFRSGAPFRPWLLTIVANEARNRRRGEGQREGDRAGKPTVFRGTKTATIGSYRARVVFPKAGRYSISVYDGFFPHEQCARVRPRGSVVIASR